MKQAYLILVSIFFFQTLLCQVSEEDILLKIDSGFNYVEYGRNLPEAKTIAKELISIGKEQNSFLAEVKGYFIMGEVHYNLPSKDSAIYWYDLAELISIQEGDKEQEARATRSKGNIYFELGLFDESLSSYELSLSKWHELKDTANIIYTLINRAWLYNQAEKTSLALADYLSCLDFAIAFKDSSSEAQLYNGLSILHKKQKNYAVADNYSEKSIRIYKLLDNELGVAYAKGNLALSYKSQGFYDRAYQIYVKNLETYSKLDFKYGLVSSYNNMTICSNLMAKYNRAIEEGLKGLSLCKEMGKKEAEADVSIELGKSYLGLEQYDVALIYSLRSLEIANGLVSLEKRKEAHLILSEIYSNLEDYKLALSHYRSFKLVNDSVFNLEKSNIVLDLQERYETAEKEKEINRLNAEAEINDVKKNSAFIVLFIVIIASILIINREIRRRKKAKKLHLTELKLNIAEKQRLEAELAYKKRELTALALQIAQKNIMIKEIKDDLTSSDTLEEINLIHLHRKLDLDKQIDRSWEQFIRAFTETNKSFFEEINRQYPDLTNNELRLCALLKMNMSSKDIAAVLNISDEGIKKARYRLRKKMGMETSDNLEAAIVSFN